MHLNYLEALKLPFELARIAAGLKLIPAKRVLMPSEPFSHRVAFQNQAWLCDNLPEWQHFVVSPKGKYLGLWLGPAAFSEDFFRAPTAKATRKTISIGKAPLIRRAAVKAFKRDAVTHSHLGCSAFEASADAATVSSYC